MSKDFRFSILEKALERPARLESDDPKYLELVKQHDEFVQGVRKKIVESPRELFSHLLETLVTQPETLGSAAPNSVRRYGYVAKNLLASLGEKEKSASTYESLEQYCIDDAFNSDRSIYFRLFNVEPEKFLDSLYRELLEDYVDRFQNAVAMVCHMVYRGLPIYVDDGAGNFREHESDNETLVFMKGMGKYFYPPDDFRAAPEWLNGLHLKRSDVDLYHLIFSQPNPPSPEEEKILIKAYQTSLGRGVGSSAERPSLKQVQEELFSLDDYADVRNDLLGQLNYLVDDVLKIPADIFKDHGTSAFTMQFYRKADGYPLPNMPDGALYQKASHSFDLLCASVPNAPKECLELLSVLYAGLSMDFQSSGDPDPLVARLKMLIAMGVGLGKIYGMLPGSPAADIQRESNRRAMLSLAGEKGARKKNQPAATLKAWALDRATGMRDADKEIAKKLARDLPAHLMNISADPERLIYEALLKQRKK